MATSWLIAGLMIGYVALCTKHRENRVDADAWEHHRAIRAITIEPWQPGNPTFARPEPSIRYSPYTIVLAAISRSTGLDPYDVLSGAAVFNTILLIAGVACLLASFGHASATGATLIVMVGLYGGAPGYANSYALADLPWHQVNPSAFSFGLALLVLALARHGWNTASSAFRFIAWLGAAFLLAVATLDHGMTGLFALIGLVALATDVPRERRQVAWGTILGLGVVSGALCLAWPWYDFLAAVRGRPDPDYWFNRSILVMMLTHWAAPAILLSLWALMSSDRRMVRTFLLGGGLSLAAAGLAFWIRSPVLARLPMPSLIFFHLTVGLYFHETGLFRLSTWPERLRMLVVGRSQELAIPLLETSAALILAYCLAPQFLQSFREPHLARAYIAPMVGAEDKQIHPRQTLSRLLSPVGEGDVVLSDLITSWMIPSTRGRIVAALHYEFFVPDQGDRRRDLDRFFTPGIPEEERNAILNRYDVRWIVLDPARTTPEAILELIDERAIVNRADGLILMDARAWRGRPKAKGEFIRKRPDDLGSWQPSE